MYCPFAFRVAAAYGVDVTVVLDIIHVVEYVWKRRMRSIARGAPS